VHRWRHPKFYKNVSNEKEERIELIEAGEKVEV
jgi:hypothetical protein